MLPARIVLCSALMASLCPAGDGSPPPGAPWMRDFSEALQAAAKSRKPLFAYFTKP